MFSHKVQTHIAGVEFTTIQSVQRCYNQGLPRGGESVCESLQRLLFPSSLSFPRLLEHFADPALPPPQASPILPTPILRHQPPVSLDAEDTRSFCPVRVWKTPLVSILGNNTPPLMCDTTTAWVCGISALRLGIPAQARGRPTPRRTTSRLPAANPRVR